MEKGGVGGWGACLGALENRISIDKEGNRRLSMNLIKMAHINGYLRRNVLLH